MTRNITEERAARRFHQMALLEALRQAKESAIDAKQSELKRLKADYDELVSRLQRAARDEGELSLFDLDAE